MSAAVFNHDSGPASPSSLAPLICRNTPSTRNDAALIEEESSTDLAFSAVSRDWYTRRWLKDDSTKNQSTKIFQKPPLQLHLLAKETKTIYEACAPRLIQKRVSGADEPLQDDQRVIFGHRRGFSFLPGDDREQLCPSDTLSYDLVSRDSNSALATKKEDTFVGWAHPRKPARKPKTFITDAPSFKTIQEPAVTNIHNEPHCSAFGSSILTIVRGSSSRSSPGSTLEPPGSF